MNSIVPTLTTGSWEVVTKSSTYLLDLDNKLVIRFPANGAGTVPGMLPAKCASFAGDEKAVKLASLKLCKVGLSAIIVVEIDGKESTRFTTTVCDINPLD